MPFRRRALEHFDTLSVSIGQRQRNARSLNTQFDMKTHGNLKCAIAGNLYRGISASETGPNLRVISTKFDQKIF